MPLPKQQMPVSEVQAAHGKLMEAHEKRMGGDLGKAAQMCNELLEKHPEYFGARAAMATTLMQQGHYGGALPFLVRADMLNPGNDANLANLGKSYLELGAVDLALDTLDRALKIQPDQAITHFFIGEAWIRRNNYPRAIEALEKCLSLEPSFPPAMMKLARAYLEEQRTDEARGMLQKALPNASTHEERAEMLHHLSQLVQDTGECDAVLDEIERARQAVPTDGAQAEALQPFCKDVNYCDVLLSYARANLLHTKGEHEDAWTCWDSQNKKIAEATADRRETYAVQGESLRDKALDWKKRKPAGFTKAYEKAPVSLFILGTSRSGKTTLERLLGQLGEVAAGFENSIVRNTVRDVTNRSGLLTEDNLVDVSTEQDELFARLYHDNLQQLAGEHDVLTVTHPGAMPDVGRLSVCIPNARFVFMRRNSDDVAARIYTQLYQAGSNEYAYDLSDIRDYISQHEKMADNWLNKLDKTSLAIDYEAMIEDPASAVAEVAKLCGLKIKVSGDFKVADDRDFSAPYASHLET